MRSFSQCTKLAHEVTFFVPSTVNVDKIDTDLANRVFDYIETSLATRFGGATENAPAKGSWISDTVGKVKEGIRPLTVYCADLSDETQDYLLGLADYIKSEMTQEAVMVVVDGQGHLR